MAKEPIYGLNRRDRDLVQKWGRKVSRAPQQIIVPPRGNQKVRSVEDRFRFRNDSGETIPPYAIMRNTGMELDDDGNLVYVMNKPVTSEWKLPWYVNLGVEVEDDDYGWCATFRSEVGQGYYLSGTIVVGESWGPRGGQWNLERYYPGFQIVGNEADGLVYVVQREPRILLAQSDSGGVTARSGTTLGSDNGVTVYYKNGATIGATNFVITAYNESATAVVGSTYLQLVYVQGDWVVNWEEC